MRASDNSTLEAYHTIAPWRGTALPGRDRPSWWCRAARAACLALAFSAGCAGDARVELSAADSIEALAAALQLAVQEYHHDVTAADQRRESAAIAAFVKRIREAADDPAEQDRHAAQFTAALACLRDDRGVEWSRFTATLDNLDTIHEITAGLRRLAVESLTLSDEVRRYLNVLIDRQRLVRRAEAVQRTAPPT